MTNLKEQIIAISKEIGISKIGFTAADNFDYLEKSLRLAQEKGQTQVLNIKILKSESSLSLMTMPKRLFRLPLPIRINCHNYQGNHLINVVSFLLQAGVLIIIPFLQKKWPVYLRELLN
jgi:hypothetical protein